MIKKLGESYKFTDKETQTGWSKTGKNDIVDKIDEIVDKFNEIEPILAWLKIKMDEEKAAELIKTLKGG